MHKVISEELQRGGKRKMSKEEVEFIRNKLCTALEQEIAQANRIITERFQGQIFRQNPIYRELEGKRNGIATAANIVRKLEIRTRPPSPESR